jgi:hypothetical protein
MFRRAVCAGRLGRPVGGVAVDGGAVGLLDRSQAGRDPGFMGGDVLAVAAAVRVLGQDAAVPLDLADVGLALIGMSGDGEHRDIGGGGIQDEGDRAATRVTAG